MKKDPRWVWAVLVTAWMLIVSSAFSRASGQSADPETEPKVTAEQQKQLDQLKQLENQLQKDRNAMHGAITQYGWDSEQTDAAQEQLLRDGMEYRKLRRALRSAGVAVPSPVGMGEPREARPGRMAGGMHHRGHGGHHCPDCDGACCE